MSNNTEEYKINCIIPDGGAAFSVKVSKNKDTSVDDLKKRIKSEKSPELNAFAADRLTLYKINVDGSDMDKAKEEVKALAQNPSTLNELNPLLPLSEVFPSPSSASMRIGILVEVPETAPMTPPNRYNRLNPYSPKSDENIKGDVSKFENDLRATFERYLRDNTQLPHWQPPSDLNLDDSIRNHIDALKIPIISPRSQFPLLLLHNLGRPSHDAQLAERVDGLFNPGSKIKFLCNTSGSGKTRLLLEGLSRNWGFYLTARTQPEEVGSSDLENVLRDLEWRLEKITDKNLDTALKENEKKVERRFRQLLYARYVCFRVFLECAAAIDGGITENHKIRWLLIQLAPVTLLKRPDIFLTLTQLVGTASSGYLGGATIEESSTITQLLPQPSTLFCVLDEAQVLTKNSGYFRSDTHPATDRPILRPIIHTWNTILPDLIVSGTGISMQEVERVINSVVVKPGGPETVTEIGGFDDENDQRAYLEQYCPPGYLDKPLGKEIVSRVGYWLRGRHRFIATYISFLIRTGFQHPHRVLNDFVEGMTGFRPSDWEDHPPLPVELKKPGSFNFESLSKKPELLNTLADFVLEYTFTGKIRGLSGPDGDSMVEYGVSRFKKTEAQTDEPLAILALVTFVEQQEKLTLARYLTNALNTSNAAYRGIALEAFGAFLLARAFSAPISLSKVFTFAKGSKKAYKGLQGELAELVTLEKVGNNFQATPLQIKTNLRPSHVLGRSPPTAADTLEWLQNPQGSAFCFPANTVGPDLIFVLRLKSDDTVLRVCVQFKHTERLSPQASEKAIRTTDPSNFLSQKTKDNNSPTCFDPSMRNEMEEAIKNLGIGTKKAGPCGLLRVVICHPSVIDSDTMKQAAKEGHPLATTVPLGSLEPPDSELGQSILWLANLALQKPDRRRKISDKKRKISDEEGEILDENEGARPKRPRVDTGIGGKSKAGPRRPGGKKDQVAGGK